MNESLNPAAPKPAFGLSRSDGLAGMGQEEGRGWNTANHVTPTFQVRPPTPPASHPAVLLAGHPLQPSPSSSACTRNGDALLTAWIRTASWPPSQGHARHRGHSVAGGATSELAVEGRDLALRTQALPALCVLPGLGVASPSSSPR